MVGQIIEVKQLSRTEVKILRKEMDKLGRDEAAKVIGLHYTVLYRAVGSRDGLRKPSKALEVDSLNKIRTFLNQKQTA